MTSRTLAQKVWDEHVVHRDLGAGERRSVSVSFPHSAFFARSTAAGRRSSGMR